MCIKFHIEWLVKIKQLKLFENMVRMGADRKPRQIMGAWPEDTRTSGRPSKTIMYGIEEKARKNGTVVTELRKFWSDWRDGGDEFRHSWRKKKIKKYA